MCPYLPHLKIISLWPTHFSRCIILPVIHQHCPYIEHMAAITVYLSPRLQGSIGYFANSLPDWTGGVYLYMACRKGPTIGWSGLIPYITINKASPLFPTPSRSVCHIWGTNRLPFLRDTRIIMRKWQLHRPLWYFMSTYFVHYLMRYYYNNIHSWITV